MDLATKLRIIRALRDTTQQELSDKTGIPNRDISKYECNRSRPTEDQEAALRQALEWPSQAEPAFDLLDQP